VWREFLTRHGIHHQFGVAIAFEGSETFAHLYLNRGGRAALRRLDSAGWEIEIAPVDSGLRVALRRHARGARAQPLTARQFQIARLYCAGYSSKDIGTRLNVSPATIRVHVRNAYARAGGASRNALRAWLAGDQAGN